MFQCCLKATQPACSGAVGDGDWSVVKWSIVNGQRSMPDDTAASRRLAKPVPVSPTAAFHCPNCLITFPNGPQRDRRFREGRWGRVLPGTAGKMVKMVIGGEENGIRSAVGVWECVVFFLLNAHTQRSYNRLEYTSWWMELAPVFPLVVP